MEVLRIIEPGKWLLMKDALKDKVQTMNIFISYNRKNKEFVLFIAEKLRSMLTITEELFFDEDNVKAGDEWVGAIESAMKRSDACIVFIGEQGIGQWQMKEVLSAMSRQEQLQGAFKIVTVIIPNTRGQISKNIPWFLADIQWIEFLSETDADAFQKLREAILDPDRLPVDPVSISPESDKNPYKGLDFFDVDDAPFFFGRTSDVNWVFYKKLPLQFKGSKNFLAIVGDSGSGKSSFARAGLLATIKAGRFKNSSTWKQVSFSPQNNPMYSLGIALSKAGIITDFKQVLEDSKPGESGSLMLRGSLDYYGGKVVMLIDQFEEVITKCEDSRLRDLFLENLTNALKSENVICIVTLRSDFYAAFSPYKEFADLLEISNYTITSIDAATTGGNWKRYLRDIIEKPARLLGVQFETDVTAMITEDCKKINGVLPALQLALVELWKNRKDAGKIQPKDYTTLANGKGIPGIIEAHANTVVSVLTSGESDTKKLALIKGVFIRLVEITSNKEDVRKTVTKAALILELGGQFTREKVVQTLDELAGESARLIRIKKDEVNKNTDWVEVMHEVLIREWLEFRKWLDEKREAIKYKNKLEQHIDEENTLLTGKKLAYAEGWLTKNEDLATPNIIDFIVKSRIRAKKRKRALLGSIAILIVLLVSGSIKYPKIQCSNCDLVQNWENGHYNIDEIHSLIIKGTIDIKNLYCFNNLDTLILKVSDGDYLTQKDIDLLPKRLRYLSINGFFINDTILKFNSVSQLKSLSISSLKGLRNVTIAHLDSLVNLTVSGIETSNALQGIADLKNLETLTLSGLNKVSSLAGIFKLENLQVLNLSDMDGLVFLTGIKNLQNLHTLSISGLHNINIDEIEHIDGLQTLHLDNLNITSIAPVNKLTGLNTLSLTYLPDLTGDWGIRNLNTHLSSLTMNLHIDSLSGIKNVTNLLYLDLTELTIHNLDGIDSLKKLQTLRLSAMTNLSNLAGIEKLTRLDNLSLSDLKALNDIADVKKALNLHTLYLDNLNNSISLAGIDSLKSLVTLELSNLDVSSLSDITNLHSLQTLSLKDLRELANLSGIEYLRGLHTLTLYGLPIPDFSGAEKLDTLQTLSLSYLSNINLDKIGNLKYLQRLSISDLLQTNLSGITGLTHLKFLALDTIGASNTTILATLKNLHSIDTIKMRNIKLESLSFINEESELKTFIFDNDVVFPNRDTTLSNKIKNMKNTKFLNVSIQRSPLVEGFQ